MVAPASYGWNHALVEAVPDTGSVDVPAPDINDSVDQDSISVAVDGDLLGDEDFDFTCDIPGKKVTVINTSGKEWDAQSNLYVSAQRTPMAGTGQDHFSDLEDEIGAVDDRVTALEARVTALEAAGAPAATRGR